MVGVVMPAAGSNVDVWWIGKQKIVAFSTLVFKIFDSDIAAFVVDGVPSHDTSVMAELRCRNASLAQASPRADLKSVRR